MSDVPSHEARTPPGTPLATRSEEVRAKHRAFLFASVANYYGDESIVLDHGKGMFVTDLEGREYLDFFGGILTLSVGHANEAVNGAVKAQIDRLGHVSTLYPTVPIVELAETLVRLAPGDIKKAFFSTSGTEADETAVALAQAYTGRTELIALRHGYSGRSVLAQSLTAHAKYRVVPTQVAGVKHGHAPYCYRCPFHKTYPSCDLACATDLEELIRTTTTGAIAGFLAEPIMGVGGFITPPDGYFQAAVEIIRAYGGIFLCDEVQTGFGRTGDTMWGIEHHGVEPEVITLAKGIANGLPLGATLATEPVAASWKGGNISTFGGNPICAAAGNATVKEIVDRDLPRNAAVMGAHLRAGLEALQTKYPKVIGDVRGRGLMQALELVVDETVGDRTPAPALVTRIFTETKNRGLLVGRGGLHENVIRIAPPLIVDRAQIDDALHTLDEAFSTLAR